MPMMHGDLGRSFTMSVCAAGSVHIQPRGKCEPGTLPVFSTDTREQAEAIQIRHCRRANNGTGLYFLNDPPQGVEHLGRVADLFRAAYGQIGRTVDEARQKQDEYDKGLLADLAAAQPDTVVLVNDLREGTGTHHPRVRVLSIDGDGDAECILIRSGNRKTIRVVTLSKAYKLIQRDYGPAVAS